MSDVGFCPHCGHNLESLKPVVSGDWSITPGSAFYRGEEAPLTVGEITILHTLISCQGRVVSTETLGIRVGESENPRSVARILVHRIRKKMGLGSPIQTVRRLGYKWKN